MFYSQKKEKEEVCLSEITRDFSKEKQDRRYSQAKSKKARAKRFREF
jgi:hypothetical protein